MPDSFTIALATPRPVGTLPLDEATGLFAARWSPARHRDPAAEAADGTRVLAPSACR